jgi:hypothetical protein
MVLSAVVRWNALCVPYSPYEVNANVLEELRQELFEAFAPFGNDALVFSIQMTFILTSFELRQQSN